MTPYNTPTRRPVTSPEVKGRTTSYGEDLLKKYQGHSLSLTVVYGGHFIEFLEFGLFSALLPFISRDFFFLIVPEKRAVLNYLVLYIGFLARPLGAYFLGKVGDKRGPAYLLLISVVGISLSCLVMASLPMFSGVIILIPLIRFLQGFFTGAEQAAATTYLLSLSNRKNTYLDMAWMTSFAIFGFSVAQAIAYCLSVFCPTQVNFWRLPFVGIALLSLLSFIPRYKLYKRSISFSHDLLTDKAERGRGINWVRALGAGIIFGVTNSLFYCINVLLNTYQMFLTLDLNSSKFLINTLSTSFFAVSLLGWALILKKITHKPFKVMRVALLGITVTLGPLFYFHNKGFVPALLSQLCLILFVQLLSVISLSVLPRTFPKVSRVVSTGVSLSFGNSIIGGFFPVLASLVGLGGDRIYSVTGALFFLIFLGFLSLSFLETKEETHTW